MPCYEGKLAYLTLNRASATTWQRWVGYIHYIYTVMQREYYIVFNYASNHRRWWPEALCFWSVCASVFVTLWARYLHRELTDLHQTWHGYSPWRVDELIRYSRSWGQRSRSYGVIYENLVCAISHEGFDGSSPNLTWLLPMKSRWTD